VGERDAAALREALRIGEATAMLLAAAACAGVTSLTAGGMANVIGAAIVGSVAGKWLWRRRQGRRRTR
jgi:hypothetical protein